MTAMARLSHQKAAPSMEPRRDAQLEGDGAGPIQQRVRLESVRQHRSKLIEQDMGGEGRPCAASTERGTPNDLKKLIAQGEHGERPLSPEQLIGGCRLGAAKANFEGQTSLLVGKRPNGKAPSLSMG